MSLSNPEVSLLSLVETAHKSCFLTIFFNKCSFPPEATFIQDLWNIYEFSRIP